MSKIDLMNRFVTPCPIEVTHITVDTIPPVVSERDSLVNYHNVLGYEVEIKTDNSDDHIKIVPVDNACLQWNENTKNFIDQLQFVPVPDHMEVPGRAVALLLKKEVADNKPQLSRTGWRLFHARMVKTRMRRPGQDKEEMAEVVFLWERDDYSEFVATCWKW